MTLNVSVQNIVHKLAVRDPAMREFLPPTLCEYCASYHSKNPVEVPQNLIDSLAQWLERTRGDELRKTKKSLLKMMNALVSSGPFRCADIGTALENVPTAKATVPTVLKLPKDFEAGHLIGKRGRLIKQLRDENPSIKVRIENNTVYVTGVPSEVELICRTFKQIIEKVQDTQLEKQLLCQSMEPENIQERVDAYRDDRERATERKRGKPVKVKKVRQRSARKAGTIGRKYTLPSDQKLSVKEAYNDAKTASHNFI